MKLLNIIELYAYNGSIVWYANYTCKAVFFKEFLSRKNEGRRNEIVLYKCVLCKPLSQLTKCVIVSASQSMIKDL